MQQLLFNQFENVTLANNIDNISIIAKTKEIKDEIKNIVIKNKLNNAKINIHNNLSLESPQEKETTRYL